MSKSIVDFPFNALLLTFSTDVNAAYHFGRRIYQQVAGPLYRSYGRAATVIVGQKLGEDAVDRARESGLAVLLLAVITIWPIAAVLYFASPHLASLFTSEPEGLIVARKFLVVFAIVAIFIPFRNVFSGSLRAAGDTKTPFIAQLTGQFLCKLGVSYVLAVSLSVGLFGPYTGIVLSNIWAVIMVTYGFFRGDWITTASTLIEQRSGIFD